MRQKLEHPEQRIAFEELMESVRQESERVERLEQAIREAVPEWSLAEVVTALQAVRGIELIAAVGVLVEVGDLSRFRNPRELMAYLGLVPSKSSTGDTVRRGGITKAGNGRARRILVEAVWAYRHPPRVSREKQPKVAAAPKPACEIAWKARVRLCRRYRSLERKGKLRIVIVTAIARDNIEEGGEDIAGACRRRSDAADQTLSTRDARYKCPPRSQGLAGTSARSSPHASALASTAHA